MITGVKGGMEMFSPRKTAILFSRSRYMSARASRN